MGKIPYIKNYQGINSRTMWVIHAYRLTDCTLVDFRKGFSKGSSGYLPISSRNLQYTNQHMQPGA